jgi:hypothetical protein
VPAREEPGAVVAAGLLVGGEREDQVARRAYPAAAPVPHHREHHRVEVLHVDRAPAPQVPVAQLTGERVDRPLAGVGRYHVEVPVHEQRAARRVGTFEPRDDAGPAGRRLADLRGQADLVEQAGDVLRGGPLPHAGGQVAGVGGVDAQQVAADVDDLDTGVDHGLAHPSVIPVRV